MPDNDATTRVAADARVLAAAQVRAAVDTVEAAQAGSMTRIKVPDFSPEHPDLWFRQVEKDLEDRSITDSQAKFRVFRAGQ